MEKTIDPRFIIKGCENSDKEAIVRPTITYAQDAWRRLRKNPIAMISLVVLVLLVVILWAGNPVSAHLIARMEVITGLGMEPDHLQEKGEQEL